MSLCSVLSREYLSESMKLATEYELSHTEKRAHIGDTLSCTLTSCQHKIFMLPISKLTRCYRRFTEKTPRVIHHIICRNTAKHFSTFLFSAQ